MAREFLMIVQESAYRVPVTTPVVWTTTTAYNTATATYIRLDEGNAFGMRARPQTVETPYGGGLAIGAYRASDKIECRGNLRAKLTTHLAPFLVGWATTRINAAQTLPWPTTEPAGDLASCTIYHAIMRADGTFKRRAYLGAKVDSFALDISSDSQTGTMNLGLSASVAQGNIYDGSSDPTATIFPPPADNNLPIDPYLFVHTANNVNINSVIRNNITQLTFNCTNTLARNFFNQRFLGALRFTGRDVSASARLEYAVPPDDRVTYEGQMPYGVTPIPIQIVLDDGVHAMTMHLNGNNVIDPLDEDLPLDDLYFQSSTHNNMYDTTAGEDFHISFAPG